MSAPSLPSAASGPVIAVIGATSAIAPACLQALDSPELTFLLCARSPEALQQLTMRLREQEGIKARLVCQVFDVLRDDPQELLRPYSDSLTGVLCLVGVYDLTDSLYAGAEAQDRNFKEASAYEQQVLRSNFTALTPLLQYAVHLLLSRTQTSDSCSGRHSRQALPPFVAVTGSVAGERGRASNFAYGAAKAGLSAYLEGLRQYVYAQNPRLRIIELRPGLIKSRMLQGRDLPQRLIAGPECVGEALLRALQGHKDVVYCPRWWYIIMTAVKLIPRSLYKKLRL